VADHWVKTDGKLYLHHADRQGKKIGNKRKEKAEDQASVLNEKK